MSTAAGMPNGPDPAMPSWPFRFGVVVAYLLAWLLLTCLAAVALEACGVPWGGPCTFSLSFIALPTFWLAGSIMLIVRGCQGRLWGCQAPYQARRPR